MQSWVCDQVEAGKTEPEFAVVDVWRAFFLSLTEGAQACVPLVEDELNEDVVHKHKQLSILTLPMQVKHLMLLLGGGTAQRTRRRRRKVIMPLNLNSNWDQIKREDHAANKAQTQKRKPSLKFYLVWWDSRSMKPVEPTLMKRLWCSSEHRCWRES